MMVSTRPYSYYILLSQLSADAVRGAVCLFNGQANFNGRWKSSSVDAPHAASPCATAPMCSRPTELSALDLASLRRGSSCLPPAVWVPAHDMILFSHCGARARSESDNPPHLRDLRASVAVLLSLPRAVRGGPSCTSDALYARTCQARAPPRA
jgi:hypothetical protein